MNAHDNHHDSRNGQRRPEDIQAAIERTRTDLNETLSAIERRLSPGELIDQGLDYLRHSGAREYASNLGNVAKQDPVPLALAGIGLAWLMMSSARQQRTAAEPGTGASSYATDGTPGAADHLAQGARDAAHKVSETTQRLSQSALERAGQMGHTARRQAERMREGVQQVVQDQPLALGAIGLAVGAVLGAVVAGTREEDEWLGQAADRLRDGARRSLNAVADSPGNRPGDGAAAQPQRSSVAMAPQGPVYAEPPRSSTS